MWMLFNNKHIPPRRASCIKKGWLMLGEIAVEVQGIVREANAEFDCVAKPASQSWTYAFGVVAALLLCWWGVSHLIFQYPLKLCRGDFIALVIFWATPLWFVGRIVHYRRMRKRHSK